MKHYYKMNSGFKRKISYTSIANGHHLHRKVDWGQHEPSTHHRGQRHRLPRTPPRHLQRLGGVAGGTKRKGKYIEMYSTSVGKV